MNARLAPRQVSGATFASLLNVETQLPGRQVPL
jgi:hypothetical protein